MVMTPEQRTERARNAVLASWSNTTDAAARTEPARRAIARKFVEEAQRLLGPDASEEALALAAGTLRAEHMRELASRPRGARLPDVCR